MCLSYLPNHIAPYTSLAITEIICQSVSIELLYKILVQYSFASYLLWTMCHSLDWFLND